MRAGQRAGKGAVPGRTSERSDFQSETVQIRETSHDHELKAAVPLEEAQELLGDVQESAIQMDMDADMEFQEERMRMDGELNMQIMSMQIPVPIESYTVKSEDKYITYTKNGEEWQKTEMDASSGNMGALVFTGQELYQESRRSLCP